MSPEFGIPCFVQFIQSLILPAQPYAERFFTVFTITFSTVFIADMPAGHMRIVPVTLSKFACKTGCKLLKHRRIRACIVALTEFVMSSLVIRSRYFRISFYHPCRKRACWSCKHDIIVLPAQHINDLIQFCKIIDFFWRLDLRPRKYIDRSTVDPGIFENAHIFFPDRFSPLVRVIISAV